MSTKTNKEVEIVTTLTKDSTGGLPEEEEKEEERRESLSKFVAGFANKLVIKALEDLEKTGEPINAKTHEVTSSTPSVLCAESQSADIVSPNNQIEEPVGPESSNGTRFELVKNQRSP